MAARRDDQQRRHSSRRPVRGDGPRRSFQGDRHQHQGCGERALRRVPYLRATRNSVVVNLASASAIYGQAELANYSATKFFIRGITEALDIEWSRYGIRVIAVWPLFVNTAMTDDLKTGTTESLGIRLTAQDIADAITAAVDPHWLRRAIHQVHFPVGSQTKVLAAGSRFSPGWLTRLVNKRLAHS